MYILKLMKMDYKFISLPKSKKDTSAYYKKWWLADNVIELIGDKIIYNIIQK